MTDMFRGAEVFNQDLNNWDVSSVKTMLTMFGETGAFNGDISNWDVSNVEDMGFMFANASAFNRDISRWNTSNVTNMDSMFRDAVAFNSDLIWDVSNVTNMEKMFSGATNFNGDISSWNVSKISSMYEMFRETDFFNCDISSWDVSNVEVFSAAFLSAVSFNQDIGSWDTSKCTSMTYMFFKASSFNQDLSSWNVEQVTEMRSMLTGVTLSVQNYNALLIGWEKQNLQDNVVFSAESCNYSENSLASAARSSIIANHNWSISDGGSVPSYSISGTVTGDTVENIKISAGIASAITDAGGNYTITGLADGTYTVIPELTNVTFSPVNTDVTINGGDVTQIDFTSSGTPIVKYTLTVNNGSNSGDYEKDEIINISADVPANMIFKEWSGDIQFIDDFHSETASVTMPAQDVTVTAEFETKPPATYSVSGTVTGDIADGVTISLGSSLQATTNANGEYIFNDIAPGTYTVTPSMNGYSFSPENAAITLADSDIVNVDFVSSAQNEPPAAADNLYETNFNTVLNVEAPGVLDNDTDPDHNTLTVSLEDNVTNGTLTLNDDGSFVYTPATNFFGSDSFTYKAYDGSLYSNIATVTINVSLQKVTVGTNVSVTISQVDGLNQGDTFDKTPKIYGEIDGKNLTLKKDKSSTGTEAVGIWKKAYSLNEKIKENFASKINGRIQEKVVRLNVKGKVNGSKIDNKAQNIMLVPPEITSCTLNGDTLVITGNFFGSKAPKVAIEPVAGGKIIKCKVDKNAYVFDPVSGQSILIATIKLKKATPGRYSVIVNNKIGIGVMKGNVLPEISL
jgi:surface protein